MGEVITKVGLTKERSSQMFQVARVDDGLRAKLLNLIQGERQKS